MRDLVRRAAGGIDVRRVLLITERPSAPQVPISRTGDLEPGAMF